MVKDLIHDPILLGRVSAPAGADDLQAAQDLLDTLLAHKDGCVGMAGNMIGVHKCIIAFQDGKDYTVMAAFLCWAAHAKQSAIAKLKCSIRPCSCRPG